jgi:hypothetical protein
MGGCPGLRAELVRAQPDRIDTQSMPGTRLAVARDATQI